MLLTQEDSLFTDIDKGPQWHLDLSFRGSRMFQHSCSDSTFNCLSLQQLKNQSFWSRQQRIAGIFEKSYCMVKHSHALEETTHFCLNLSTYQIALQKNSCQTHNFKWDVSIKSFPSELKELHRKPQSQWGQRTPGEQSSLD